MKINIFYVFYILLPFITYCQTTVVDETDNLYYKNGIPSINKSWTPEEYTNSIKKIIELSDNKILELPNSKKGKDILLKITDFDKYWFLNTNDISKKDKMIYVSNLLISIKSLFLKYAQEEYIKHNKSLISRNEITILHITLLKLTDKMIENTDEFILENTNLTDIQKEGLNKMKYGVNTIISGTLMTIEKEYMNYSNKNICDLSKLFFDFYKKNKKFIDINSKNEFDKKSINLSKNHKIKCVKEFALLAI